MKKNSGRPRRNNIGRGVNNLYTEFWADTTIHKKYVSLNGFSWET